MTTDKAYQELKNSLVALGVESGDVLLLKGDLAEIGLVASTPKESRVLIFKVLWDVLGGEESGTLVTSSFTEAFFRWNLTDFVFDEKSPSKNGGAITKYFLQHSRHVRSKHPTNSFVAIGKHAHEILKGHDETARPYDPVGKVIALNGKVLGLGTVAVSPDFMTSHYSQQQAGLTSRTILKWLTAVKYKKGEVVSVYKVKEAGGCSRGYYKTYAHYVKAKKLKSAFFGNAYSIGMRAKDAYEIARELHLQNPRNFTCDDPDCFSCRGTWFWNMREWPAFYFRNLFRLLKKRRIANV